MGIYRKMLQMAEIEFKASSNQYEELFFNYQNSKEYTDVTLVCDDKSELRAHKMVLSACSSLFRKILFDHSKSNVIYLDGIKCQDMKSLLDFMYFGATTFAAIRINEVMNIAKHLEITKICEEEITNGNLTIGEVLLDKSNVNDDAQGSLKTETHQQSKQEGHKYFCKFCNYLTSNKSDLLLHVESVHEGVKYPCNQCDRLFSRKNNLVKHIVSIHEGKKFMCNQCGQQ